MISWCWASKERSALSNSRSYANECSQSGSPKRAAASCSKGSQLDMRAILGKVVFHPDQRVCEAIQLVFTKFRELWSVRQTFQWFRDHDVELPANPIQGTRRVW